jgi:hypothetical protein
VSENPEEWNWGNLHKMIYKNEIFMKVLLILKKLPVIGKYWERRIPANGNRRTLNVAI